MASQPDSNLARIPGRVPAKSFFAGTAVVTLCLATPAAIVFLMFLDIPMNPGFLIVAAVLAVIGLMLALNQNEDAENAAGGPPEDDF